MKRTLEFDKWLSTLSAKGRLHIEARLLRVESFDHFGDAKYLGDGLAELRWKSGWRVYFSKVEENQGPAVLMILGGSKHDQKKDIEKARLLLRRYAIGAP